MTTAAKTVADRIATAATLDELRDIIAEIVRYANEFQLSALDRQLAALPTFGGEDMTGRKWEGEPIWSWDSTRLLVGAGDLRIVERPVDPTDDE